MAEMQNNKNNTGWAGAISLAITLGTIAASEIIGHIRDKRALENVETSEDTENTESHDNDIADSGTTPDGV